MIQPTEDDLIRVCSLRWADRLLGTGRYDALLSIGKTDGSMHCSLLAKKNLLLDFHDETPWHGRMRGRLMTGEDMVRLVRFAKSLEAEERCLIHCKGGRCRSVAAAVVMHYVRFREDEVAACRYVAERVQKGTPNGWVLAVADAVLRNIGDGVTLAYVASYTFPRGVKWHEI